MDAAIDALVGRKRFSAFVRQALSRELQREGLAQWLDECEAERGGKPLGPEAVEFAEQAWRFRSTDALPDSGRQHE
jgi:hypothetical protein